MTATDAMIPALLERDEPEKPSSASITLTPFDRRQYQKLIQARAETIREIVTQLKPALELANALDAGCGVGFFSQILQECGLYTRGFDGRLEYIVEARKRFPRIAFAQADIEDPDIVKCGKFDLVLYFGLLCQSDACCAAPLRADRQRPAARKHVHSWESGGDDGSG